MGMMIQEEEALVGPMWPFSIKQNTKHLWIVKNQEDT